MTGDLSRRHFLLASAAAGGGLLVGLGQPAEAGDVNPAKQPGAVNPYIRIAPDGLVTVLVPRADMGQGIHHALAMIAAEELDADWAKVTAAAALPDAVYTNITLMMDSYVVNPQVERWFAKTFGQYFGLQMTGGSTSLREGWRGLRVAAAGARAMLVEAAARRLGMAADRLQTADGMVVAPDGRRLGYGELAADAAKVRLDHAPAPKPAGAYRLIGHRLPRLDIPAKVTGAAEYGIDVRLEGMLHAAVLHCPVFGGSLKSYDAASVQGRRGVRAVLPVPGGVAVVADSYWRAQEAAKLLTVEWTPGPHAGLDDAAIFAQFERDMAAGSSVQYEKRGEGAAGLARGARRIAAQYRVPFLAHATMEPMNATAQMKDGRLTIWTGTQVADLVQRAAAELCGLAPESVIVHTTLLGGGFGRRLEIDYALQAVTLAKALAGTPVKLVWSREEDMRHDCYRPAALARFEAAIDANGQPLAWVNRQVAPPVIASYAARNRKGLPFPVDYMFGRAVDTTQREGSADLPYEIPHRQVEFVPSDTPVPVGFWRSVGHSFTGFFVESFMDELAHAAGQDPFAFRRHLLRNNARWLRVLETAASKAGWGERLATGRGRGIAIHGSFKSVVAQVVDVTVSDGSLKVDRVVCAVDCGMAIHPDTVTGQMESGIVYALSAALYGRITIGGGGVVEDQFSTYPVLQMHEAPAIDVHIVGTDAEPGGVGEPGVPPLAAALANAIFAATGKRIRELPLADAVSA
jgi:isoquinoline 1-oxidoreductase beta subunit